MRSAVAISHRPLAGRVLLCLILPCLALFVALPVLAAPDGTLRPWDSSFDLPPAAISEQTPDYGFTDHGRAVRYFFDNPRTPRQTLRNLVQALANGALAKAAETLPALAEAMPDNPDIQRISAMVVALAGRQELARALLGDLPVTAVENDYEVLARAALAQHSGALTSADALANVATANNPDNALAHNFLGTIAWRSGRIGDAIAAFRRAGETGTGFAAPWRNLLAIAEARNDAAMTIMAADRLLQALAADPDAAHCPALLSRARAEAALNRLDEAVASLRDCLAGGWQHRAGAMLASALIRQGRLDEAPRVVSALSRQTPQFAAMLAAEMALRQGEPVTAAAALGTLTQEHAGAAVLAALNAAGRRNWPESLDHLDRAAELGAAPRLVGLMRTALLTAQGEQTAIADAPPQREFDAFLYAAALQASGKDDLAADFWRAAQGYFGAVPLTESDLAMLAAARSDAALRRLPMATMLFESGFAALALRSLGEVTTGHPLLAWFAARCHQALGNQPQAMRLLDAASAGSPPFGPAAIDKAGILLADAETDAALLLLQRAARAHGSPAVILRFADRQAEAGLTESAGALYAAAADGFPEAIRAQIAAGYHFADRIQHNPAAAELADQYSRAALALDRDAPDAIAMAGWVDYRLDDTARAARQLRRALDLMTTTDPGILVRLALVEQAIGNRAMAREHVARALAIAEQEERPFPLYAEAVALGDSLQVTP